jgi:hypothetical protein
VPSVLCYDFLGTMLGGVIGEARETEKVIPICLTLA